MRGALLPVLVCLLTQPAVAQTPAPARRAPAKAAPAPQQAASPAAAQVIGCASLANLRQLLRAAKDDQAAALAVLGDEHADHLGCSPVPRERVVALSDHVALGGQGYDCLGLRDTGICHWTLAGAIPPPDPQAATRRTPSPPHAATDHAAPEKARR